MCQVRLSADAAAVPEFRVLSRARRSGKEGMDMTEDEERKARERDEIAARVAAFRATQEKFKRERDEYFVSTLGERPQGRSGPRSGRRTSDRRDQSA